MDSNLGLRFFAFDQVEIKMITSQNEDVGKRTGLDCQGWRLYYLGCHYSMVIL